MMKKDILSYLVSEEAYDASVMNCFAFRRGTDVKDGITLALGNMVSGFPFVMDGVKWLNSECAYIAGTFSDGSEKHLDIQRKLVDCSNGFMAKKGIRKPNEDVKRTDWEEFNIMWMLYVVWSKVKGNEDFRRVLLSLPSDAVIIEDSTFQNGPTATVWGTRNALQKKTLNDLKKALKAQGMNKVEVKRQQDALRLGELSCKGLFVGKNVMGKILMICRDALLEGVEPQIDYDMLRSRRINIMGKVLEFGNDLNRAA